MSRKPTAPANTTVIDANTQAIDQLSTSANALVAHNQEQNALVRATAATLGYQLPADATDPDLIQRDIAANMRRSVEACLEVGRGLAVLKAACGPGNFIARLDVLGIDRKVAVKFMQSATKFSNVSTSRHLTDAIGGQSKLFEMLVLDDEQIDELANFGQTGELSLDDVATMSVKELRTALRELKAEHQAGEDARADLSKKLTKLQIQAKRIQTQEPDAVLVDLTKEAQEYATEALGMVRGKVRASLDALTQHYLTHRGDAVMVTMAGMVGQLQAEINAIREKFNLPDVSNAADEQLAAEVAQWANA
jgi:hypothetical protein